MAREMDGEDRRKKTIKTLKKLIFTTTPLYILTNYATIIIKNKYNSYDIRAQNDLFCKRFIVIIDNFSKKDINFLFTGFSVSSLFYNFLIELLPTIGIDTEDLQSRIHYKIKPVLDGERVSFIKVYRLWTGIENLLNRSDIGLLIADYFTLSKAGIIGELFLGTKNLRESIEIIKRFLSLMINNIHFRYEEVEDDAIFYFDIVPRFVIPLSITECYIKICYNWVREYSGMDIFPIEEISFYRAKPKHFKFYELNFPKAKVSFSKSENFIILKKDIFYKKNKNKLSLSYEYILKHAQNIKKNISNSSSFTQKITNQILINMPEGKNCICSISKNLNVSTSTIKRKLYNENTNFKRLVEITRKELSISMLKDKNLTYEEISYLLGYSQYSPFFRAFKNWYHDSPSTYREKLLSGKLDLS